MTESAGECQLTLPHPSNDSEAASRTTMDLEHACAGTIIQPKCRQRYSCGQRRTNTDIRPSPPSLPQLFPLLPFAPHPPQPFPRTHPPPSLSDIVWSEGSQSVSISPSVLLAWKFRTISPSLFLPYGCRCSPTCGICRNYGIGQVQPILCVCVCVCV